MRFEQLRKKTTIKKEVKIYYWHIYGIIRLSSGSRQMDPKMIEIEEQKKHFHTSKLVLISSCYVDYHKQDLFAWKCGDHHFWDLLLHHPAQRKMVSFYSIPFHSPFIILAWPISPFTSHIRCKNHQSVPANAWVIVW